MGQAVGVFLSCLLILMLMAHQCQAATGLGQATIHQDFPNNCWDKDQGKLYPIGEEWQMSSGCGINTCMDIDGELYVQYKTCGVVVPGDFCTIHEGDPTQDYPYCCGAKACV